MGAALIALVVALNASGYVRVVAAEDIASTEASALRRALEIAIERRIGAEELAKADVEIKMFGGLTLIRLIAERRVGAEVVGRVEVDVPIEQDLWVEPLEGVAATLFPIVIETPPVQTATRAEVVVEEKSFVPWIVLGASVVAAGVGVGFGASSRSSRVASQIAGTPEEYERLADRTVTHAIAADVLWIGALIGGSAAAALYLSE